MKTDQYLTLSDFILENVDKTYLHTIANPDRLEPYSKNITAKDFDLPGNNRYWFPKVEEIYQTTAEKDRIDIDKLIDLFWCFNVITGGCFITFTKTQLQYKTGNNVAKEKLLKDTIDVILEPYKGTIDFESYYHYFYPNTKKPILVDRHSVLDRINSIGLYKIEAMDNVDIYTRLLSSLDTTGISRGYMNILHLLRLIAGNWF